MHKRHKEYEKGKNHFEVSQVPKRELEKPRPGIHILLHKKEDTSIVVVVDIWCLCFVQVEVCYTKDALREIQWYEIGIGVFDCIFLSPARSNTFNSVADELLLTRSVSRVNY